MTKELFIAKITALQIKADVAKAKLARMASEGYYEERFFKEQEQELESIADEMTGLIAEYEAALEQHKNAPRPTPLT